MTETCKCPNCGAQMNRDIRPEEITFKGRTLTVRQPMSNLLRLLRKHPEHLKDLDTTSA